jgi:hypothetical protein
MKKSGAEDQSAGSKSLYNAVKLLRFGFNPNLDRFEAESLRSWGE